MPEAKSCYLGDGRPFPGKHGRSSDLIGQDRSQLSFPALEHHDRWKSVTISELMGKPQKPWYDAAKGYRYSDDRWLSKGVGDYMAKTDDREEIDAIALQSLNQFVEICQNADIQVLFVEMPSANSWNMARHQAVADYASDRNIPFIDFNMKDMMTKTGFDWLTDSRDGGNHLNYSGAKKISRRWLGIIWDRSTSWKTIEKTAVISDGSRTVRIITALSPGGQAGCR